MKKLSDVFGGDKSYPLARINIFFDELRGLSPSLWEAVVQRLVKEELRPPMMKEIRVAIATEKTIAWERDKRQEKREVEQMQGHGKNLFTHEGFANHPVFGKVLPIKKREAGE